MKNIYIVTSLPRTGTTSLCSMATSCGLNTVHVLGQYKFKDMIDRGYSFFSDTPFYIPEFLSGIIEALDDEYKIKLIYCHRDQQSWIESFTKLVNRWTPSELDSTHKRKLHDILGYSHVTTDTLIETHYKYIREISHVYNLPLLDYSFEDKWEPFCEFLNAPIPNIDIPHINKS